MSHEPLVQVHHLAVEPKRFGEAARGRQQPRPFENHRSRQFHWRRTVVMDKESPLGDRTEPAEKNLEEKEHMSNQGRACREACTSYGLTMFITSCWRASPRGALVFENPSEHGVRTYSQDLPASWSLGVLRHRNGRDIGAAQRTSMPSFEDFRNNHTVTSLRAPEYFRYVGAPGLNYPANKSCWTNLEEKNSSKKVPSGRSKVL